MGVFEVEGSEGIVHKSTSNPNTYTVWFNKPNPIEAKVQFFNKLHTDAVEEEKRISKELENAIKHTNEITEKFASI